MGAPMKSYLSRNEQTGGGLEPLTVSVRRAEQLIGVGHTTIYKLIADGSLETVLVRGRRLVSYRSIKKLLGQSEAA
jgi:excisionase family DNA binding protein